ncbi:hypothetical protein HDV01_001841 [Terramyces sp. JEL0728]|nr:hypothetical protein HDV01_001841 [Terramyces sp. JEL0728]
MNQPEIILNRRKRKKKNKLPQITNIPYPLMPHDDIVIGNGTIEQYVEWINKSLEIFNSIKITGIEPDLAKCCSVVALLDKNFAATLETTTFEKTISGLYCHINRLNPFSDGNPTSSNANKAGVIRLLKFFFKISKINQKKRNRRLNFIEKNLSLFTIQEIKHRLPLLYHKILYFHSEDISNLQLSERIQFNNDEQRYLSLVNQEYEEESDDEIEIPTPKKASEMKELELELVRLAKEFFLDGKDDFDYSKIDNNVEFDDLRIIGQDIEDLYFDEE